MPKPIRIQTPKSLTLITERHLRSSGLYCDKTVCCRHDTLGILCSVQYVALLTVCTSLLLIYWFGMVPRGAVGNGGHFVVFIGDRGGMHFCASGVVVCVSSTVPGPN